MKLPLQTLNTEYTSAQLRSRSIDVDTGRLLMTQFRGTQQEKDLTSPPNCDGYGRVRHFRRQTSLGWPSNPLPIDPACKFLGLSRQADLIEAQVFQNAACNWRCWYCFVPYELLSANSKYAGWASPAELIKLYMAESKRPPMIDLTGGQPDLIPEWVPETMRELRKQGLEGQIYLWSDDNLSNDYFWKHLSKQDHELVASFNGYGRVCCFKGFNEESFAFNTLADPQLFEQQFELMKRFLDLGIDLYAYATFTTPSPHGIEDDMARFVDRLQSLDRNLPLRTVPLEISVYSSMQERLRPIHEEAMRAQRRAISAWEKELEDRFGVEERNVLIADVTLQSRTSNVNAEL